MIALACEVFTGSYLLYQITGTLIWYVDRRSELRRRRKPLPPVWIDEYPRRKPRG